MGVGSEFGVRFGFGFGLGLGLGSRRDLCKLKNVEYFSASNLTRDTTRVLRVMVIEQS